MAIVGHSLGGGLAALSGAVTRLETVTFNSVGVHQNSLQGFGVDSGRFENIRNIYATGDLLTVAQQMTGLPNALGAQHPVGSSLSNLVTATGGLGYGLHRHRMSTVRGLMGN